MFEWDEEKNRANVAKHGISFRDAVRLFEHPVVEQLDDRRDYGEERIVALGLIDGFEAVVVYTDRADKRRNISARWAQSHERQIYWEALEIRH
jgi:hypothetical protein